MDGILRFVFVALILGVATPLCAAPFFDPTRPPEDFLPLELQVASKPRSSEPVFILESVLLSPQRKSALINGQRVELGQRIGDYRLETLGSSYARLRGPRGAVTLKLSFPKKASVPVAGQSISLQGESNK